jgi:hypothetical protein
MRYQDRGEDREVVPLIAAIKKYWGRVEFAAFPISHVDTTLIMTLDHLTAPFSPVHPYVSPSWAT